MTREQMISTLRGMDFGSTIGSKGDEALRMAIAELEQPCDDDRQKEITLAFTEGYMKGVKYTEQEPCDDAIINKIRFGIQATDGKDSYSVGMRNGIKWALSNIILISMQ